MEIIINYSLHSGADKHIGQLMKNVVDYLGKEDVFPHVSFFPLNFYTFSEISLSLSPPLLTFYQERSLPLAVSMDEHSRGIGQVCYLSLAELSFVTLC